MSESVPGDIVQTEADARNLPRAPLIVLDSLVSYLDSRGIGHGDITLRRIGEGHSNVTYALRRGPVTLVLRRGPRPPIARSTHDMLREARTQQALHGHGIPVPDIVAVCDDNAVMGVPFYLMDMIDGEVITGRMPAELDDEAERSAVAEAAVDALATLGTVSVDSPEIAALGRPDGYLDRQIKTFTSLWDTGAVRTISDFDIVAERLRSDLPISQASGVVHGDFRLGNMMFAPAAPVRLAGILDWEMSTLGDPLADLGYFLATWSERGETASVMELSPVTRREGFLSRSQLAQRYHERTGVSLDALGWYQAFALWKAAVFCEEIYQRWRRGESAESEDFARVLERGVPDLLHRARALL